ncbi:MAG TPA: hypothetical protein DCY91_24640 [Cyanobacteria bacterium UBA11370]|nr:hypothetical protein [Cyanobacteria bacterium UBA11370]
MSTILWNALKISPALLGASLLVASSTYAAQTVPNQDAAVELNTQLSEISVEEVATTETTPSVVSPALDIASNKVIESTEATNAPQVSVDTLELSQLDPAASDIPTNSNSEILDQVQNYSNEGMAESLDQVTNIGQLRDVSPGDWAYEALRGLVERYGCIAGYPDGTYRGNRAMTRYEFAAGLNACLNSIERLIGTAPDNGEDIATLRRLIQEFEAELATLGARVDNLEGRVAFLEDHQFSTTTKLKGEVIFALADTFGDTIGTGDDETNTIFADRVRLSLDTSFTGKDTLRTRLQARNITEFDDVTGTNMSRLSFDGDNDNDVEVDKLWYRFALSDKLRVQIDATGLELYESLIDTVNPYFASSGSGSISRFGRFNPIYRTVSGGPGAAITYNFSNTLALSAAYTARDGEDPGSDAGLFNGTYSALAQLTFKPTNAITLGLTYAHSYYSDTLGRVNVTGSTGSDFASKPFDDADDVATSSDSFGVQANANFGKFSVGGWVGYQDAEAESGVHEGESADIWNWAVNLALPDLGGEGNLLGFVFGMPPKVTGNDIEAREDDDTSFHIEGLYRYKLSDNIAITPGVIVILNPEHNDDNDTIWVGTLRTTFSF